MATAGVDGVVPLEGGTTQRRGGVVCVLHGETRMENKIGHGDAIDQPREKLQRSDYVNTHDNGG
jgi:hypothetical protein